ncbi:MAG: hypothetical protein KF883_00050 [Thermomicrobiales bacterium]|nr:hypothetical protein [Thermomicrobiales bacterium]
MMAISNETATNPKTKRRVAVRSPKELRATRLEPSVTWRGEMARRAIELTDPQNEGDQQRGQHSDRNEVLKRQTHELIVQKTWPEGDRLGCQKFKVWWI